LPPRPCSLSTAAIFAPALGLAGGGGAHDHVGQARRQRHLGQGPAVGGQAALPVQGLQAD
jgi:hypothetical protein